MTRILTALLLLSVGCGYGPIKVEVADHVPGRAPAWVDDPNIGDRTRTAAYVAAQVWGGDIDMDLTIRYVDDIGTCGGDANNGYGFNGCTAIEGYPWDKNAEMEVVWWANYGGHCLEATALAHEIGHVVVHGDPGHGDSRWKSLEFWNKMAAALADVVPLDDPNYARCVEYIKYGLTWGME